MKVGMNISFTK